MPQTVKVLAEAEAHPGPSLVIAYSHCIAHGIDMSTAMSASAASAVDSGYWPLWRYDPEAIAQAGEHPFHLDSQGGRRIPLKAFASKEARFAMLARSDPARAEELQRLGAGRRRRPVAPLRTARRGRPWGPTNRPARRRSTTDRRWRTHEPGPAHHLPRPRARQSARAVRLTAGPTHRDAPGAPGCRCRRRGVAVAVRGADRARGDPVHGALEAGAESYAEALTYLPEFADYTTGTDAYLRHVEATGRSSTSP